MGITLSIPRLEWEIVVLPMPYPNNKDMGLDVDSGYRTVALAVTLLHDDYKINILV